MIHTFAENLMVAWMTFVPIMENRSRKTVTDTITDKLQPAFGLMKQKKAEHENYERRPTQPSRRGALTLFRESLAV